MTTDNVVAQRAISIALLESLPCYAMRVPPNQKDPGIYAWDPATRTEETSRQEIHRLKNGDDNIGVHLFGHVVDVDIDTDDPLTVAALDYFLPHTAHIWGRKSRPKTHRLYQLSTDMTQGFDPADYRFLMKIKDVDELKIEVRGGERRSGRYTLMPGSIHPSGEVYEWENMFAAKTTPSLVDLRVLMRKLRYACVASLIARYWTEGQRNDMCQALAGFLWRAAQHSLATGSTEEVPFEYEDAVDILEGIMHISGDDEADERMRKKTLEKTWEKADEGHPVTGAKRLEELTGRKDLVSHLYLLLVNSAEMQKLDEFMSRFAKIVNTSDIVELDLAGLKDVQWMMSVADFGHSYKNQKIQFGDGTKASLPNMLLNSPQAIEVHGLGFNPEKENLYYRDVGSRSFRMVNTWRGCDIDPADDVEDKDVEVFTNYIWEIVANQNQEAYDWVMAWIADIFQHPGTKAGTALVLVGKTGAGKSVLGDRFIRKIIGTNHSMQVNNVESLTGKFNADTSGSLFIQCDEAMNSNRRADAQRLKSAITDPTKRLEKKGFDAYQVEDFARFLFTSNELLTAVAIIDGMDDRRYTVLEVNPMYGYSSQKKSRKEKSEYWDSVYEWTNDKQNLAKVYRYLLNYKYDRKLVRTPLDTEAKTNMAHQSQQGVDDWLMTLATMGHPFENLRDWGRGSCFVKIGQKWEESLNFWPEIVTMSALVESYNMHRRSKMVRNGSPDYNPQQLKIELSNRGLMSPGTKSNRTIKVSQHKTIEDETVVKRVSLRCVDMFTRETLLKYLDEKVGLVLGEDGELIDLSGGGFGEEDEVKY